MAFERSSLLSLRTSSQRVALQLHPSCIFLLQAFFLRFMVRTPEAGLPLGFLLGPLKVLSTPTRAHSRSERSSPPPPLPPSVFVSPLQVVGFPTPAIGTETWKLKGRWPWSASPTPSTSDIVIASTNASATRPKIICPV
ncbi:hypothetical protein EDB89DRAFT_2064435 [Lactarius sanguifluus]|nr:hypothetical protein EDB89DRAFT_2064435 [Lactarius sanguifluus]